MVRSFPFPSQLLGLWRMIIASSLLLDESDTKEDFHYMDDQQMPCFAAGPPLLSSCGGFVSDVVVGNAFDMIVLESSSSSPLSSSSRALAASDAVYSFGSASTGSATGAGKLLYQDFANNEEDASSVVLEIEYGREKRSLLPSLLSSSPISRTETTTVRFPIRNGKIQVPETLSGSAANGLVIVMEGREQQHDDTEQLQVQHQHDPKALHLLRPLLQFGNHNRARFLLLDGDGEIRGAAPFHIFLWSDSDRVIVVDIDGTITKSNVRGVLDTVITETYSHCHEGVCRFFSSIVDDHDDDARVVYLTSRPIALANSTRKFLAQLRQAEEQTKSHDSSTQHHSLPYGALFGFPGSFSQFVLMEMLQKSTHEFKSQTLLHHVVRPFQELFLSDSSNTINTSNSRKPVFLAGFGNTLMDTRAYHMAGMDLAQIYLIDKESRIHCLDQHQKSQTATATTFDDSIRSKNLATETTTTNSFHWQARGSLFHGYHDANLLKHLIQQSSSSASTSATPKVSLQHQRHKN